MTDNQGEYQNFPAYTTRSRNSPRLILVIIGFFILFAVILGGLYFLGTMQKKPVAKLQTPLTVPTQTPLPTSSVSAVLTVSVSGQISPGISLSGTRLHPTTQPVSPNSGLSKVDRATNLDRSSLVLAVLNGSGEAGAAKGVSAYLESLGYKIARVGNADVFTYKNFTVIVKRNKSGFAGLLKKDLSANPAYASVSASISDDITGDAEVIVGK